MKTFSSMSIPDKILTRQSYLRNLAFINQVILSDTTINPEQALKLKKDASRLQILIDTLDAELLNE